MSAITDRIYELADKFCDKQGMPRIVRVTSKESEQDIHTKQVNIYTHTDKL